MTKSEFEELKGRFNASGMTLKSFFNAEGIAYSTYNYWNRIVVILSATTMANSFLDHKWFASLKAKFSNFVARLATIRSEFHDFKFIMFVNFSKFIL